MIPTNRDEFAQYCLRNLGEPVIKVDVSIEQIDDRIDEALYVFRERNYEASEDIFIYHDITDADKAQGYIQLDSDILGVTDVFRPRYFAGIQAAEFEFFMQQLYTYTNPTAVGGGMAYFYMHQSHLKLLNRFFNPDKQYDYNKITNKLIIAGGLKATDNQYGGIIIRAKKYLQGSASDEDTSNTVIHNIWKNKWLQDYCTALIRRNWGRNLGKYQSVQLLGGVTMNGNEIMQAAEEDLKELKEDLLNTYELPPDFIIG